MLLSWGVDHVNWFGCGLKHKEAAEALRVDVMKQKVRNPRGATVKVTQWQQHERQTETKLSGINMWKVKYQLPLHLRGQYHYPLTGKAEKKHTHTHSSSGIIKLFQWENKVSSSSSWLHSSAIWGTITLRATSVTNSSDLTQIAQNSTHELKLLTALVAATSMSRYFCYRTGYTTRSPALVYDRGEPVRLLEFQDAGNTVYVRLSHLTVSDMSSACLKSNSWQISWNSELYWGVSGCKRGIWSQTLTPWSRWVLIQEACGKRNLKEG